MVVSLHLPSYKPGTVVRVELIPLVDIHPSDRDGGFSRGRSGAAARYFLPHALGVEVLELDGSSFSDQGILQHLAGQVVLLPAAVALRGAVGLF